MGSAVPEAIVTAGKGHLQHIISWAVALLSTLALPLLSVFHLAKGLITELCLPGPSRLQNAADHTPPKAAYSLPHGGDVGERLTSMWTSRWTTQQEEEIP